MAYVLPARFHLDERQVLVLVLVLVLVRVAGVMEVVCRDDTVFLLGQVVFGLVSVVEI